MAKHIRRRKSNSKKGLFIGLSLVLIFMTLILGTTAVLLFSKDRPARPEWNSSQAESDISSHQSDNDSSEESSEPEEESSQESSQESSEESNEPEEESSQVSSEESSEPEEESSQESSEESSEPEEESSQESSEESSEPEEENSQVSSEESSEPENEPEKIPEENINYEYPDEMKAMFITAGVDFFKNPDDSKETITKDIDTALDYAQKYGMNSIVFTTKMDDRAIYANTVLPAWVNGFDALGYALDKAQEMNFYTYAVYDANDVYENDKIAPAHVINGDSLDIVSQNLRMFSENYHFDGIILDNYYNNAREDSYNQYIKYGGGIGYDNYMHSASKALFDTCSEIILRYSPGTQVGMLTEPVWKNKSETDEEGSATSSPYTVYYDGNCDSIDLIQSGKAHFVMVKAPGSTTDTALNFENVVNWWANEVSDDMQYYVLHSSSKMATDNVGWTEYDQLIKQVMVCEKIPSFNGSAFDSLSRMIEDPKNSATNLIKYYNNEINPDHVLKELAVTSPKKLKFETFEKTVTFKGASDPNTEITINGQKISTDQNGYFLVDFDLQPGDNTFKIVHKGKQVNYSIYRRIVILKEFTPVGSLAVDGGTQITVSALAYADAKVTATIAGQTVPLTISDTQDDNTDHNSDYVLFEGTLNMPKATKVVQNLGNIVFSGNWNGMKESKTGANVSINKYVPIADGKPVEVIVNSAETFPTNVINDYSAPSYYPLPKGTKDFAVGKEIVYNDGKKTFSYFKLASNVRVYKSDIRVISDAEAVKDNKVNSVQVTSDRNYTYVTVDMDQKVSYSAKYSGNTFSVKFNYTSAGPGSVSVKTNPLFSSGSFAGQTLTLSFAKSGSFIGYHAYYKGDKLVLRFNNPPRISGNSLNGVRIVIDSGHGGTDPGAEGFLPAYPESAVVKEISMKLYDELTSRGADVKLIYTNSGKLDLKSRIEIAKNFNPHVLVSVHANSAKSSVTGTEAYYFYPFSKALASTMSANVSRAMATENRGGKFSYMYMTRDSQFASTLLEVGFLSNRTEYKKLISSSYQSKVADAIANSITAYLKSVSTGGSYGSDTDSDYDDDDDDSGSGGLISGNNHSGDKDEDSSAISLDKSKLTLKVGQSYQFEVSPKSSGLKWESYDEDIADVSSDGEVFGGKPGKTTIAVTTKDGKHTAECDITVVDTDSDKNNSGGSSKERLELNHDELTMSIGDEEEILAKIYPESSDNYKVTWKIEPVAGGSRIIEVESGDDYAYVTAVRKGKIKVTAISKSNPGLKKSCTITIK